MRHHHFTNHRWLRLAAACCLIACAWATAIAAETAPYEARVIVPGAAVHSGPGENFYATETLAQGVTVEVYREHPSGWLAIRPPDGSFSWVAGRDLTLQEDGLAEITEDSAASRIGTQLGEERNAVQVRLKQGEVVEVIGEDTIEGVTWYKIAPPAGEFRWMHSSNVEQMGPLSSAADEVSADTSVVPASATDEAIMPVDAATKTAEPTPQTPDAAAASTKKWQAAGANSAPNSMSAPPLAPLGSSPPTSAATAPIATSGAAAITPLNVAPAAASSSGPPVSVAGAPQPAGPASDDIDRQLAAIELRLSRMAAAPLSQWNTERLERDTEQLLGQAQTPAERDAVKATMAKIDRFGALSRQYDQSVAGAAPGQSVMAGSPDPTIGLTAGLPAGAGSGDPRTTTGSPAEAGRYDAVGILRPVVSKRLGAPQFALVDERGTVVSFVTPTPDVNLQPYLGHRVGVVGNRGFIPEFQRAHVTAGRVQPLSERLVR